MVGAVAGSPGTPPTNGWVITNNATYTSSIIGTGIENGINYIDIQYVIAPGAAASGGIIYPDTPAATASTAYTGSLYVKLVSGTSPQARFVWQDNVSTYNRTLFDLTSTLTRYTDTLTTAVGASLARLAVGFAASPSGATFVIRIGLPQVELGAFATSVIPTTSATVTRAADVASIAGSNFGTTRTNLLVRSEEFDNASWTKTRSSITANAITAPDGTLTGDKLIDSTDASASHFISQSISFVSGTTYTVSIFAKQDEIRYLRLGFNTTPFGTTQIVFFDLLNGVISSNPNALAASITDAGNGWWRLAVTATATSTASDLILISLSLNGTSISFTGTGTNGLYIWGAQLEVGSAVTPYIQSPSVFTSRASSGTYVGGNGLIQTAVTNLSLRSQELGDAAWTKTLSSITADAAIAPNGTTTADKLVEDSSTGIHNIVEATAITYTNGLAYTFSFFVKKAERQTVQILMHPNPFPGTVGPRTAVFNSNTGAFVSVGSAYTGSSVTAFSDGWYRVSVSSISDATATGNFAMALCSDDIGTTSYTGNGTSGLFLWGAQLEQASTVGEYIPTTSTINSAARYDHDPVSLLGKGLLLEDVRTNLSLYSEDFGNAIYSLTAATVSTNTSVAPDGTTTADTVNSSGTAVVSQSFTKAASAITYTGSLFVKGSVTDFSLTIDDGATINRGRARFNLSTGTLGSVTNDGTFTGTTATITSFPNGWYRLTVTTTTNILITARLRSFWSGAGTSIDFWGAQLETGAFPTSYIPTTTATVTRAADISTSVATSVFESSWYNQTEGTVFADNTNYGVSNTRIVSFSDNSTSNRFTVARGTGSSGNINTTVTVSGVAQVNSLVLASSLSFGSAAKAAVAIKASDFAGSANGLAPVTQATGSIPTTFSQITIGNGEVLGTNTFFGTLRRITYWPTRLSNEVLQRITQ